MKSNNGIIKTIAFIFLLFGLSACHLFHKAQRSESYESLAKDYIHIDSTACPFGQKWHWGEESSGAIVPSGCYTDTAWHEQMIFFWKEFCDGESSWASFGGVSFFEKDTAHVNHGTGYDCHWVNDTAGCSCEYWFEMYVGDSLQKVTKEQYEAKYPQEFCGSEYSISVFPSIVCNCNYGENDEGHWDDSLKQCIHERTYFKIISGKDIAIDSVEYQRITNPHLELFFSFL